MLEITNVTKTFNARTVNERIALNDVSLRLNDRDFVTVIGGNGAGKSTLLNAIAGVWPVDSGRIVIDGIDVTSMPEYSRALLLGRVDGAARGDDGGGDLFPDAVGGEEGGVVGGEDVFGRAESVAEAPEAPGTDAFDAVEDDIGFAGSHGETRNRRGRRRNAGEVYSPRNRKSQPRAAAPSVRPGGARVEKGGGPSGNGFKIYEKQGILNCFP